MAHPGLVQVNASPGVDLGNDFKVAQDALVRGQIAPGQRHHVPLVSPLPIRLAAQQRHLVTGDVLLFLARAHKRLGALDIGADASA